MAFSPEQFQAIAEANRRAKKVLRASSVATFNVCTFGFFAACGLLIVMVSALMGEIDVVGSLVSVALGALAWNEWRGRKLLRRFDLRGPRVLGWNQVALLCVITGYCAWMLAQAYSGPSELERDPAYAEIESQFGDISELSRTLSVLLYGSAIVASVLFQGINAVYYFTRAAVLRAYLAETPPAVVEIQRSGQPG
jgi:hypothetical protein